jgi:hypothetical protein
MAIDILGLRERARGRDVGESVVVRVSVALGRLISNEAARPALTKR